MFDKQIRAPAAGEDRATLQDVLARTAERIAQVQQHIDRQRAIVAEMESFGLDVTRAKKALAVFEHMLEAHFAEREQLMFQISRAPA